MPQHNQTKAANTMHRFYLPRPWDFDPEHFKLPDELAHHAANVLRMKIGDEAYIFDGISQISAFLIVDIQKKNVFAKINTAPHQQTPLISTESRSILS